MATNPAPQFRRVTSYPTPVVSDRIFFELHDDRMPSYKSPPAYGTPHPKPLEYPQHKLVLVTPADDTGWSKWYYAADRSETTQETYNYAISYPYGGDESFPRYTRTYVIPRADYVVTAPGTADPTFTDAKLVAEKMDPLDGEIGSLYVQVTRIYDRIPGGGTHGDGSGSDQTDGGYTVDRPIQDKDYVKLTWKLTLPREIADAFRSDDLAACPIPEYSNLKLVDERITTAEDNNQVSNIVRVYEGMVSGAAHPSEPSVVTKVRELPGIYPPDRFLAEINTISQAVRIVTPEDVALTGITVPASYTLIEGNVKPEGTNSGERNVTFKTTPTSLLGQLSGKEWDDNLRDYVPYTIDCMTPAQAAAIAETDGVLLTVKPINRYWSIVTRESPRETSIGDISREFETTMPYTWPAVLQSWRVQPVSRRPEPGADPTYDDMAFTYYMKKAWSGICKATVQVAWSKTKPLFTALEAMTPTTIQVDWPIGRVDVPSCLHEAISFSGTTGSEHPLYGLILFNYTVPATNYTDWPASLVVDYDVTPYKGGYLIKKTRVYKPY